MLKISKLVMLIAISASSALVSCEKKEAVVTENEVSAQVFEKIHFQKVEKFISIAWGTPLNEVY